MRSTRVVVTVVSKSSGLLKSAAVDRERASQRPLPCLV
jgi:hypothetical protein